VRLLPHKGSWLTVAVYVSVLAASATVLTLDVVASMEAISTASTAMCVSSSISSSCFLFETYFTAFKRIKRKSFPCLF
jgi:hypothetical protein